MRMRWLDLLFAHWIVPVADVRPLIPAALQLDLFEGRCYVGAVPFLMENVGPRYVPPLPGLHAFPELNLRTYVTAGGKPGVWFFSLDAGQKLAVRVARKFFHLPYFDAKFDIDLTGGAVAYNSVRTHKGAAAARFSTRLTNAFRKKWENHWASVALRYCWYNFGRVHKSLRTTPAMAAGISDHIWSVRELLA